MSVAAIVEAAMPRALEVALEVALEIGADGLRWIIRIPLYLAKIPISAR
jgi:hypothetical protein